MPQNKMRRFGASTSGMLRPTTANKSLAFGFIIRQAFTPRLRYGTFFQFHCRVSQAENRRMIRKLKSGEYRLYSRKRNPKTSKRRNLGTFRTLAAAKRHERAVQFFKRRG